MKIRIYDSDEKVFDRYTIIIDEDVYGMSHNPLSPQGFNQWCCNVWEITTKHLGKEIKFDDCPTEVQVAINDRTDCIQSF